MLLLNTMRLLKIIRFKTDKELLNAFNNAVEFKFNIDDYTVSICVCIKIFSILYYKVNNIRSTLNELMLIIIELKNVHKRNKSRTYLKY